MDATGARSGPVAEAGGIKTATRHAFQINYIKSEG